MIESLPDVSHLRYRGEPVRWHWLQDTHPVLLSAVEGACEFDFFADAYAVNGSATGPFFSRTFRSHLGTEEVDVVPAVSLYAAAAAVVVRCVEQGLLKSVDGRETGVVDNAFVLSPELLALASAVAQRQGQSLDDLLTRIVTTKVVSIAVVNYRDDPEIRRLHINLAESWGRR